MAGRFSDIFRAEERMSFFTWKDSFNTGISEIDSQHRSIVEKINQLYEFQGSEDREKLCTLISDLTAYTTEHFTLEENLFEKVSYPERKSHIIQHDLFREKLASLESDFEHGRSGLIGDALQFLKEWFMNHILTEDIKYKPYIGTINTP